MVGVDSVDGRFTLHPRVAVRFLGDPGFKEFGPQPKRDPHLIEHVELLDEDRDGDWAILRCQCNPAIDPLRFMLPKDVEIGTCGFRAYGFPEASEHYGKFCSGSVIATAADGLLQLYSPDVAAGLGESAGGFSGSPVLDSEGRWVAFLRSAETDPNAEVVVRAAREGLGEPSYDGPTASSGTLYATPLHRFIDALIRCRADVHPSWLLPKLSKQVLPDQPFRDLEPYTAKHAPVFFGRDEAIAKVYLALTDTKAPPLFLLRGQAGVGKSSLLAAGLIPLLSERFEVRSERRGREGLLAALDNALKRKPEESVAAAWDRAAAGRALVVVLDQAEEAFTQAEAGQGRMELIGLAQIVHLLFELPNTRRSGRVVLSYRKEWHADIERVLVDRGVAADELHLDPLRRDDVLAAVKGVYARLTQAGLARVDDSVPGLITSSVCRSKGASHAPVLQVVLTQIWSTAKVEDDCRQVDAALVRDVLNAGVELESLLTRKLEMAAEQGTTRLYVDSGLVLDVLEFHTTAVATAGRRSHAELKAAYAHVDGFQELVDALVHVGLLLQNHFGTRLVHDAIAPLVWTQVETSNLPGQRARRRIRAHRGSGDLLSAPELNVVKDGLTGMRRLDSDEAELVIRSAMQDDDSNLEFWLDVFREEAEARLPAIVAADLTSSSAAARRGAIRAIALSKQLREEPGLRALVIGVAIAGPRRTAHSVADAIARGLKTLNDREKDALKQATASSSPDTSEAALSLAGALLLREVDVDLPPLAMRRARALAAEEYERTNNDTLYADAAAVRSTSIRFDAAWLILFLPAVTWIWLRARGVFEGVGIQPLDISNLAPMIAVAVPVAVALAEMARRASIRVLVHRSRRTAWRALLTPRIVAVLFTLTAFGLAYGKVGAWVALDGHQMALEEYPVEALVAFTAGIVPYTALLGSTWLVLQATMPGESRWVRYALVIACAAAQCWVPLGLLSALVEFVPPESQCDVRISQVGIISTWAIVVLSLGTIAGPITIGVLKTGDRSISAAPGDARPQQRRSWVALAVLVVLAISGTFMNVQFALSTSEANPIGLLGRWSRCEGY